MVENIIFIATILAATTGLPASAGKGALETSSTVTSNVTENCSTCALAMKRLEKLEETVEEFRLLKNWINVGKVNETSGVSSLVSLNIYGEVRGSSTATEQQETKTCSTVMKKFEKLEKEVEYLNNGFGYLPGVKGKLPVVPDCPPGFISSKYSCYVVVRWRLNWLNSQALCLSYGGKLAEIDTKEELRFLLNYIRILRVKDLGVWVGGSDLIAEGQFRWSTTQKLVNDYLWASEEPNNHQNKEHCVHMRTKANYLLNDLSCSETMSPLCEIRKNVDDS